MAEVPPEVIKKLLFFTFLMITAPLLTFFGSQRLFDSSVVSGGLAALVANMVMIAYVYVAFNEDLDEDEASKEKKED